MSTLSSDRLNIFPRVYWVVCPLGSTRGHGRRVIYPGPPAGSRIQKRRFNVTSSNCRFPVAWPLGQQRGQRDLFIFSSFGRRFKKRYEQIPLFFPLLTSGRWRPSRGPACTGSGGETAIQVTLNLLFKSSSVFKFSNPSGVYHSNPPAVPTDAA